MTENFWEGHREGPHTRVAPRARVTENFWEGHREGPHARARARTHIYIYAWDFSTFIIFSHLLYTFSEVKHAWMSRKSIDKNVPFIEQRGAKLSDFRVCSTPSCFITEKVKTHPTMPLIIKLQFSWESYH